MEMLPEQDTRMSEILSISKFSLIKNCIAKTSYGNRNGTENTIFIAFLYSLMSYLNIKTANALYKVMVTKLR